LFVRSLQNASHINPGFKLEGRLAMWVNPTQQKQTPAYTAEFYRRALERVRALPGVQIAGLIDYLPISLAASKRCYAAAGQATMDAHQQTWGGYSVIAPDYFAAIGIPLRHGRDFSLNDTPQTPGVVIVNETLARSLWPNTDPLGQQLRTGEGCSQTLTVVGLAADSQYTNLGEAPQPHLYIPFAQQLEAWGWRHLVIHAPGASESLLQTVSRELQALSPDVVIREAQPLARHLDLALWPARAGAAALGGFGLLALLLAWVGIYGVMSYVVSRRTQEIGVRLAMGAQKKDVLRMVLSDGLVLIVTGAVIGLSLAFAATRLLKEFLYGVSATDPLTFSVILLLLTIVALVACWIPARRAMKVDPVVALRCE
jgi:putative ABC transport system permease protein